MKRLVGSDLERQLGFRFVPLLKNRPDAEPLWTLVEAVDPIIERYSRALLNDDNTEARRAVSEATIAVLNQLGPRLWPLPSVDSSSWLEDATVDNCDGLYPRNLSYSVEADRNW